MQRGGERGFFLSQFQKLYDILEKDANIRSLSDTDTGRDRYALGDAGLLLNITLCSDSVSVIFK